MKKEKIDHEKSLEVRKEIVQEIRKGLNKDELIFLVPSKYTKQIENYTLMRDDIVHCLYCWQELLSFFLDLSTEFNTSQRGLFDSTIITYGKLFSSTNGRGKLESKIFNGDERLLKCHGFVLSLRKTFVAHYENCEHEQVVSYIRFDTKKNVLYTENKIKRRCQITKMEFEEILHLLGYVSCHIAEKLKNFVESLPSDKIVESLMEQKQKDYERDRS